LFSIRSLWLKSDDYPKILGAFDVGVCLHFSSSGYDLPMKVVDMFSAQLPVMAIEYPTIKELVTDNVNGYLFKDINHLSKLLFEEIENFNNKGYSEDLNKMSENLKQFANYGWTNQWKDKCLDKLFSK